MKIQFVVYSQPRRGIGGSVGISRSNRSLPLSSRTSPVPKGQFSGLFANRIQALVDISEILLVHEQVEDEQGGEYQAGVFVDGEPLVPGDVKLPRSSTPMPASFGKDRVEHQS